MRPTTSPRGARRAFTRTGLAALATTAALAFAACGGSDEKSGDGASTAGGDAQGVEIGVSVPTVEGPFFTAMLYGINDEARKLGHTVKTMDAGGYGNVDQQVTQFQNLAVQQVKAILVDPADPTTMAGPIQEVMGQQIPVIGAGDPAPGADSSVSASHCDIGIAMARGAIELLPDGGTLGILAGPPGAAWSGDRLKCFKDEIAGAGIEIKAEKTSDPAVEQGVTIASDFLQRFPDLDLIYGADDTVGVGAAKAVQAADRCGKTKVLTAVLGRQAEELLKEGCINYIVAQQTVKIGRLAVETAIKVINGETVPKDIAVPLIPVTKENVDSVDIAAIREPDGYKP